MNKLMDDALENVVGGFDKSRLNKEELKKWHTLIDNAERVEKRQSEGLATENDVSKANELLEDFIREMMTKYNTDLNHSVKL